MPSFPEYGGFFDIEGKNRKLQQLETTISTDPNFWSNTKQNTPILREKKFIEVALSRAKKLAGYRGDLDVALELAVAGDEECHREAEVILAKLDTELSQLEVESLLGGEVDINGAVIKINAGAGGTESCDWASMLFRMYVRFAERKGWKTEIFDILDGEEAGLKNVMFQAEGEFAFGMLKAEAGVHRLVRISPFDANARRHTSFASVAVTPLIDDAIDIEINDADLRVDTYRASGAGGQHVNKTDSAIRITHIPTGIVVQCQSQRSQHQNRDQAMKILRSHLYERKLEERRKAQQALESEKTDIAWGHQIRSYVLHPYKLVKDHRTDVESHSPDSVLDGDLDQFINAFLSLKAKENIRKS